MTQTGYANAIINTMLGWLKGLANWVLKLFNLAGGGSPLEWLSRNWLKLLILFMIIGVVTDRVVWLIRWRPYWAWFKKKRIIVNDERMLAGEALADLDPANADGFPGQSYVVRGQTPRRTPAKRAPAKTAIPARSGAQGNRREVNANRKPRPDANSHRTAKRPPEKKSGFSLLRSRPVRAKQIDDELFEIGRTNSDYADFDQDHVFDVSNLPGASNREKRDRRRRK